VQSNPEFDPGVSDFNHKKERFAVLDNHPARAF
jgi:hypothetical protein